MLQIKHPIAKERDRDEGTIRRVNRMLQIKHPIAKERDRDAGTIAA